MSNTVGVDTTNSYLSEAPPIYADPNPVADPNNVRLRHMKSNIPAETTAQPAHFILSTGDFHLNEKEQDAHVLSRNKHKTSDIIFLVCTALVYLLHTLRSYIPEHLQTSSHFWASIKPLPITRVHTIDFRTNPIIENLLLRSAEIIQTLWLFYILSFILRRTHLGYIYRNPSVFNSLFCSLLISAVSLQTISQTPVPLEVSCACLFVSFILLLISCRLIAVKLVKYEEKFKTIDLLIIRYFGLNSLFLYTTSIAYLTICSSIECFAFRLDPTAQSIPTTTAIGLAAVWLLVVIYYLVEQLIYDNEFRSVWTPYLFLAIAFHCPPFREFSADGTVFGYSDWNYYFLWALFSTIVLLIFIRAGRQILTKYREIKRRALRISFPEEKSLETENL